MGFVVGDQESGDFGCEGGDGLGFSFNSLNPFGPACPVAACATAACQAASTASADAPAAPSTAATAAVVAPDPTVMYSKYFSLGDLCVSSTATSLGLSNLPLDTDSQNNLKNMGTFLDAIQDNVGKFTIASCYRSQEVQNALRSGSGPAATMAVAKSYHSMGLAADITPANGMTATQFAQAIYNNAICAAMAGQICDKSEGGGETSLHISLQTAKFPTATPMYVVSGLYYRMTATQIGDWMSSQMSDACGAATDFTADASQLVGGDPCATAACCCAAAASSSSTIMIGAVLAAAAVGAYFYFNKKSMA